MPRVDIGFGSTETHIYGINGTNVGSSIVRCVTINTDSQLGSADLTAGTGIAVTPSANTLTISASAVPNSALSNSTISLTPGSGISISGSPISLGGSATISLDFPVSVANGGTGASSLTSNALLVGNGTSGISALSVGTSNTVLLGNTGSAPSFGQVPNTALANSSVTLTAGTGISVSGSPLSLGGSATISLSTPVSVANGGTGASTLNNHGVLIGSGTSAIAALSVGATNTVLLGSTGANPSFGQVPNAALANSSVTLTGGTGISITGSPLSLGGSATISLSGPTTGSNIVGTASPAIAIASLAGACWLGFNATALSLTKASAQTPIPYAATMSNLYVYVTGNLSTGAVTVKVNVNGVNSALSVTIPALTTGTFTNTTNSISISQGDQVQFEVSTALVGIVTGVIAANLRG